MKVTTLQEAKVVSMAKVKTNKGYTYNFTSTKPIGSTIWILIRKGKVIKEYTFKKE